LNGSPEVGVEDEALDFPGAGDHEREITHPNVCEAGPCYLLGEGRIMAGDKKKAGLRFLRMQEYFRLSLSLASPSIPPTMQTVDSSLARAVRSAL